MFHSIFRNNNISQSSNYQYHPSIFKQSIQPCNISKSLDHSINIKINSKPKCNFNIFLGKDFLQKKIHYSKNDQSSQNVYYRSFDSPKRRGLSPNGSKKIVIQYSSPQPTLQNSRHFQPFYKPLLNNNSSSKIQNSFIISSPIKINPKNIYTNQNTPPKAKFLQKKSSRKNSQDKLQYTTTPVQGLTLVESQRVKIHNSESQKNLFAPYKTYQALNKQQIPSIKQISPVGKLNYFDQVQQTSTKNFIQRLSSPQSSASPFNSLMDTTPRAVPYGSFSSNPIIPNDSSQKKKISASIKQVGEFNENQSQIRLIKKASEPVQNNKIQYTPKSFELTPKGDRYSYQKFDKTLGKLKPVNNYNDNELIYSESDKQTLNNHTGSQRIIGENIYKKESNYTKSEKNIRPASQQNIFEKKKINFETVEISDNFETLKSKYKIFKQQSKGQNKKQSNIRFYPLGDNKKNKIKTRKQLESSSEDKNQQKSNGILQVKIKVNENQNIQMTDSSKSSLKSASNIKVKNNFQQEKQEIIQQPEQPSNSSVSNVYAAELSQELKLNYDYYIYKAERINFNRKGLNRVQQNGYKMDVNQKQKQQNYKYFDEKIYNNQKQKYKNNRLVIGNDIKDSSISQNEEVDITF